MGSHIQNELVNKNGLANHRGIKMKKPSKGIIICLLIMFMTWLFHITQLWDKLFKLILKIGIRDINTIVLIDTIFAKNQICYARYTGAIIGGIIILSLMWGIFRLKNWARRSLLFLISLGIIIYAMNLPKLFLFYRNIFIENLWLGYYLFALLVIIGMGYSISMVVFFMRRDIKSQFS